MKKPIVIDVMGPPNSGKTPHIGVSARTLKQRGFKVRCIQDQIGDAPFEDELEKNRWAIRELGNLISEAKQGDWDFILVDRGAWAYFASVMALIKNGRHIRSEKRLKKARRILNISLDITHDEDFFILIKVPPETSLQIDQQFSPGKMGTINNPAFLSILDGVYQYVQGRLPPRKTKVINGENDFHENQQRLLQAILSLVVPNNNEKEILQDTKPSRKGGGLQWKKLPKRVKKVEKKNACV